MRRNEFDVSDAIQTTDAAAVGAETQRIYRSLYDAPDSDPLERSFTDLRKLYDGEDPEYWACDTEYHDIQHVLDVTLAMARLLDGYERGRKDGMPRLTPELFEVGVITALFHDFGYLRRRGDHTHRYGSEYTLTHVTRGSVFLRRYLAGLGLAQAGRIASRLVHYTGYERPPETIRINDELLRRIGQMLGTADIIAQMSDRCYLEKCRDRLYPEFVLGGIARPRVVGNRTLPGFTSGEDLVRKTPGFYQSALKRLDLQLARAYEYAGRHFGGQNLYLEDMQKNIQHAKEVAEAEEIESLRRTPPNTLQPDVEPFPSNLEEY